MDMVAIFLGGLQVEDISNVVVVTTPCRKEWLDLTLLSHCNCIDPDYPHEHSMPISVPPGKEYRHQASYFFVQMVDPEIPMEISHLSQRSAPDSDDFELHDKTLFL